MRLCMMPFSICVSPLCITYLVNIIGVIYNPVKSEKKTFKKYKTFLIKMLPLGKNLEWGSGHGHIPPWPWSFYQKW